MSSDDSPRRLTEVDRFKHWRRLLEIEGKKETADFESVKQEDVKRNTKIRVITQDVLRTRADEKFFRSGLVQAVLRHTLIRFCSFYRIEYMQGLNEILAPVLAMDSTIMKQVVRDDTVGTHDFAQLEYGSIDHPFQTQLLFFENLMVKLSPTTFWTRGVDALQVQLTTFHLLLMYHEPMLALILRKAGMTPDIYAMSWLITLFARRQPVHRVLHIWDLVLQLDAPQVWVYLAVALIRSRKHTLLGLCADRLPETLVGLKFESDEEVDAVFAQAVLLMRHTPSHITEELSTLGFGRKTTEREREKGLKDLWHRPCIGASAKKVAESLAYGCGSPRRSFSANGGPASLAPSTPSGPTDALRYVVLDCRRSVEQQQHDALYIEGSVSIPYAVQEEICALARQKSLLFDQDESDPAASCDALTVERSFARLIGQLTTRAATVLTLLWTSFVTHTPEEVHFAIADDSTGPYQCSDVVTSPLNTSYALHYDTASSRSESSSPREGPDSQKLDNLPQYLTNSGLQTGNASTVSFASALIILGFPRVAIVQPEDLHRLRTASGDSAQYSCTDGNSFSSLPALRTEMRSSAFSCLVHHLGGCGVIPAAINARYSHLQTPIDHFKEYQICAFIHELRSASIADGTVHPDIFSGYRASLQQGKATGSQQDLAGSVVGTPRTPQRAPHLTGISIVASVLSSPAGATSAVANTRPPSTARPAAATTAGRPIEKSLSSSSVSTLTMAFGAFSPGSTPRGAPALGSNDFSRFPIAAATTGSDEGPRHHRGDPHFSGGQHSGGSVMKAKVACTLDVLCRLVLIMSAQKKQHIIRLIATVFFHSCVPALRAVSPSSHLHFADTLGDEEDIRGEHEQAMRRSRDYSFLLGSPPPENAIFDNSDYYRRLEALLALRDTLQELSNTQRLNTVVDKTSNKASTKLRLLKNTIDQSAKHSRRALAALTKKTTLRVAQHQQHVATHHGIKEGEAVEGSAGATDESGLWKTTQDLKGFFLGDDDGDGDGDDSPAHTESCTTSVHQERDSSLSASVDQAYWDQQARSRLYSSDSVGLNSSDIL